MPTSTNQTTRYAIVPSRGCYGSGSRVRAVRVCADRRTAMALAARWTRTHQAEMRRYGGTSGGYRVVECSERTAALWLGHELDRLASL